MFQCHWCPLKLKNKRQTKPNKDNRLTKKRNNNKSHNWICRPSPNPSPNAYTWIFSLRIWKEIADLCDIFWGIILQWYQTLSRKDDFIQLTTKSVSIKETQRVSYWVRLIQTQVWDLLDLCVYYFFPPSFVCFGKVGNWITTWTEWSTKHVNCNGL